MDLLFVVVEHGANAFFGEVPNLIIVVSWVYLIRLSEERGRVQ